MQTIGKSFRTEKSRAQPCSLAHSLLHQHPYPNPSLTKSIRNSLESTCQTVIQDPLKRRDRPLNTSLINPIMRDETKTVGIFRIHQNTIIPHLLSDLLRVQRNLVRKI